MTRPALHSTPPRAVHGASLIELMTAITIGLLILVGLTSVFVNSSTSNRELKNTAEQIENGRYAIELLSQDIRHAGFYGELSTLPAVPAVAPDPCVAPAANVAPAAVDSSLALPLQRIDPASIPAGCAAFLTANLAANSDVVVVRRTETIALPVTCTTSVTLKTTPTAADPFPAGYIYLQTTPNDAEIQIGGANNTLINSTMKATGAAYTPTLMVRRDQSVAVNTGPGTCTLIAAQFPEAGAKIRKYITHIYFVAPCSVPSNGTSICTGGSDDKGLPIPTLKRLETGAAGAFSIVSMVEGIQAIRIEYGTDTIDSISPPSLPGTVQTGLIGDGVTDAYTHTPTLVDMGNTIAARLYVLARNTAPTKGYVDDKTYTMGNNPAYTYTPSGAQTSYKRHVYGAEVRVFNQAGRREIPR